MKYRYAQARGLAVHVADDAARFIAGRLSASSSRGAAIVAVNPGPARTGVLSFTAADVPDRPVLEAAGGELFAVQAVSESGEPALFFDEKFRPAQLRLAMGLVRNGEIMSHLVGIRYGAACRPDTGGRGSGELRLERLDRGDDAAVEPQGPFHDPCGRHEVWKEDRALCCGDAGLRRPIFRAPITETG